MTRPISLSIRVRIDDGNGQVVTVRGREAWALRMLATVGDRGCTPIDHPGPRWASYVHDLRKLGFVIETVRERHGGDFPGEHARYVLHSRVVILDGEDSGKKSVNPSVVVRSDDRAERCSRAKETTSGRF